MLFSYSFVYYFVVILIGYIDFSSRKYGLGYFLADLALF